MKKVLFLVVFFVALGANAQELARVSKTMNKYVFWYSEPVQPYEVVFSFASTYSTNPCPTISGIMSQVMEFAVKESGMQSRFFDGIIVSSGARDMAIKFKSDTTQNDLATINRIQGKYVFVFSQPYKDSDHIDEIKVYAVEGFSAKCLTITQRTEKILKEAEKYATKKKVEYDAIIQGDDAMHSLIKFK